MKIKPTSLLLFLIIISCSKSDSGDTITIDASLLVGQWFHVGFCETQNNLILNSDGSYIHTISFNTCDNNEYDTYQYTGTYVLSGNNITFNNFTEEIIEEG